MTRFLLSAPALSFMALSFVAMSANAQTDATLPSAPKAESTTGWAVQNMTLIAERGFGKRNGQEIDGQMLYPSPVIGPGSPVLACIGNRTMLAISTTDTPAYQSLPGSFKGWSVRSANVKITIDGEPVKTDSWIYNKGSKLIYPKSSAMARKFYNAAIRGQSVQVKYRDSYNIDLPKPDATFADWGGPCGIGRNAETVTRERARGPLERR